MRKPLAASSSLLTIEEPCLLESTILPPSKKQAQSWQRKMAFKENM